MCVREDGPFENNGIKHLEMFYVLLRIILLFTFRVHFKVKSVLLVWC